MPRRPPFSRRWLTALSWPVGVSLTSWDYVWRTTVMHRREISEESSAEHLPPAYPDGVDAAEVQGVESGYGPLFHRRYSTRIRECQLDPETVMSRLKVDLNRAAPTKLVRFQRVLGDGDTTELGDELVVRMPGPWDGPVRVISDEPRSFRLATLDGHLEAGQIEFRVLDGDATLGFEIESWARSGGPAVEPALPPRAHVQGDPVAYVDLVPGGRRGAHRWADDRWDRHRHAPDRRRLRGVKPPPRLRRRLAQLSDAPVNYDVDALDLDHPPAGWHVDTRCQPLVAEPPGDPVPGGSWEIAGRLIRGYEFADPSLVRAFYDPEAPLQGREMLLELRALGLVSVHVGVRVVRVYDGLRTVGGRSARVFGWAYRTLRGHVERGQMDWQVWKWLDTGEVQFRVHSVARVAPIANPVIWVGFHVLRRYERRLFLDSTDRRMKELTLRAVGEEDPVGVVRAASPGLTARSLGDDDPSHEILAQHMQGDEPAD